MSTLLLTEWRLQVRHGVVAAVAGLTAIWCVGMLLAPPAWRPEIGALALFFDLTGIGLFFVPALIAVDRGSGVTWLRRLGRVEARVFLAVRVMMTALLSMAAGTVVLLVAGAGDVGTRLAGVLGLTLVLSLVSIVAMGGADGLPAYLGRLPFLVIPLLVPALLELTDLVSSPLLGVSPVTSAMRLIRDEAGIFDWLWSLVWIGALVVPAIGAWQRDGPATQPERTAHEAIRARISPGRRPMRAFAAADRRTLAGDRLLWLILAGVPVMALAVRWFGGAGIAVVRERWGLDLQPELPFFWALVLVVHTPVMMGAVAGMLFLEDRDSGVLPVVKATRTSLRGLIAWRSGATALASGAAVVVLVPLADAAHAAGPAGLVATAMVAGAAAVPVSLIMATLGRDRVQGMAVMKVMGVPLYLPLAGWFASGVAVLPMLVVPTAWAAQAFWADSATTAWLWAAGGVAWSAVLGLLLARRFGRTVVA